uniref:B12-binding domain-containing radical SAM protein n=1 Tax=Agathobacter sp. TaxID=2021311 RepID=UPI004056DAC4
MASDIALIFTPIDYYYKDADTHYAPPLGLVSIENYLHTHNIESMILDGSVVFDQQQILDILGEQKPKFVGQSVQLISYKNALEIAKFVHSYGGINILGGHHATQMGEAIMKNKGHLIDYVIVGDGEEAWLKLVMGEEKTNIPNIVYAENHVIHRNKVLEMDISQVPTLNYDRVDLAPYRDRLAQSNFSGKQYSNYLRFYSHKGCGNRKNSNGCVFCGRADLGVRFKSAEKYWDDIMHCVRDKHADYLFDVGDDLLFSKDILRQYLLRKPEWLPMSDMGIFGRANRVDEEVAEMLHKLGVVDVVIGFETGDPEVMKLCNKSETSPEQNIYAAECLTKYGMDITASYVLGLPGETEKSLYNTVNNAKKVYDIINKTLGHPPKEFVANLLEPSPGSAAFRKIVQKFPEKYKDKDELDLEELQRDYFYCYFDINNSTEYHAFRKKLRWAAREIHSMVEFCDSQGWLQGEL